MRVEFGRFTFDGDRRQLLRGVEEVHLTPKAFELLALLVESRPHAVSKADIQERLWPRTIVSEVTLACLVNEVRGALGEPARRPLFVRTVHGFGYAFDTAALADRSRAAWRHVLVWGDREFTLKPGLNVVGRQRGVDVWVPRPSVSRVQARVRVEDETVTLEDAGSRNVTYRETEPVRHPVALVDGNQVRIGSVTLVYRRFSADLTSTLSTAPPENAPSAAPAD